MKIIKTAYQGPKVGIFWFLDNHIVVFSENDRDVVEVAGFKDSQYDHWSKWEQVKQAFPQEAGDGDYSSKPRGRVIWAGIRDQYEIIVGSELSNDMGKINKVMIEFSLPVEKTVIVPGEYDDEKGG